GLDLLDPDGRHHLRVAVDASSAEGLPAPQRDVRRSLLHVHPGDAPFLRRLRQGPRVRRPRRSPRRDQHRRGLRVVARITNAPRSVEDRGLALWGAGRTGLLRRRVALLRRAAAARSEERRVGKGGGAGWWGEA